MQQVSQRVLRVIDLGLRPYSTVWELQRDLQQRLILGDAPQTLIVCEHPPVITCGKSARSGSLKAPLARLKELGVDFFQVERGGDYTYHGPGQLVGYPIIDLRESKRDVGWYLRNLEEVIIQTLHTFGVPGRRVSGRTGVWTHHGEHDKTERLQKLASIGVRLSRWCTMHGFALNVLDCSEGFSHIHPCGFHDISMSSMEQEGRVTDLEAVKQELVSRFCQVFDFRRDVNDASADSQQQIST